MIITFDSNVSTVAETVSKLMNITVKQWCVSYNNCNFQNIQNDILKSSVDNSSNPSHILLYNTPLSMSENMSDFDNIPNDQRISFVYVDYKYYNSILKCINKNKKGRSNIIVISNGEAYATGDYVIHNKNTQTSNLCDFISLIMKSYECSNKILPLNEIINNLYIASVNSDNIHDVEKMLIKNPNAKCSIANVLNNKRKLLPTIKDCEECSI